MTEYWSMGINLSYIVSGWNLPKLVSGGELAVEKDQ